MTIERGRSNPKRASVLPLAATVLVFACSGDNGTGPGSKVPAIHLAVNPATVFVQQGSSGSMTVSLTRVGGFSGVVTLAVTGLPTGITASIAPAELSNATATATVNLIVAGTIAAGPYTATVTATSAGVDAAIATFQVGVLWALGDVKVTTQTSGIALDTDGYVIQLDSPWDYELEPTGIAANGTVVLRGLSATSHVLTLLDVAANCTGEKLIDRPITVAANTETAVVFKLECK
jgi:hypothetical protein